MVWEHNLIYQMSNGMGITLDMQSSNEKCKSKSIKWVNHGLFGGWDRSTKGKKRGLLLSSQFLLKYDCLANYRYFK